MLAVFYAVMALTLLLVMLPAAGTRPSWEVMGSVVTSRTFLCWSGLIAIFNLYMAHAFWRGIRLGFLLFVALKPAGWIVYLYQGVTTGSLVGIVVEALILAYVVQNREWFRN